MTTMCTMTAATKKVATQAKARIGADDHVALIRR